MKALVITPNRLGDAVITCGVIDHIIRANPDCRITIACGPVSKDVFARMPNLEGILVVDKRRFDVHWLDLWRRVVGARWDLVLDFRGSGLAYTLLARKRAVHRRTRGLMSEQYAAALGIVPPPLPVIWTIPPDHDKAASLLPPDRPIVAIAPTANWLPKVWPADRFAALFRAIVGGPLPNAVAAVFGGPGDMERDIAGKVIALLPEAIDLCGKLRLPEVAACFQRADLFVGNDSGLMHLAAAAGAPTIGLFGPTLNRASEMAPAGPHALLARGAEETMDSLSVDTALDTCKTMLERSAPAYLRIASWNNVVPNWEKATNY